MRRIRILLLLSFLAIYCVPSSAQDWIIESSQGNNGASCFNSVSAGPGSPIFASCSVAATCQNLSDPRQNAAGGVTASTLPFVCPGGVTIHAAAAGPVSQSGFAGNGTVVSSFGGSSATVFSGAGYAQCGGQGNTGYYITLPLTAFNCMPPPGPPTLQVYWNGALISPGQTVTIPGDPITGAAIMGPLQAQLSWGYHLTGTANWYFNITYNDTNWTGAQYSDTYQMQQAANLPWVVNKTMGSTPAVGGTAITPVVGGTATISYTYGSLYGTGLQFRVLWEICG